MKAKNCAAKKTKKSKVEDAPIREEEETERKSLPPILEIFESHMEIVDPEIYLQIPERHIQVSMRS